MPRSDNAHKGNMKFEDLYGPGENPNGIVMQNANGTIVDGVGGDGSQFRPADYGFTGAGVAPDGERWNRDPLAQQPMGQKTIAVTARARKP